MTYGNIVALWQNNVVRLLAYSTVAQAGFFLIAVTVFREGALVTPALVVFALAYAAMNIGAFAIVQWAGKKLEDFNGLGRAYLVLSIYMTIFLFSLVGIPPLAGFAGKFLLFGAAINNHYGWLAVAAIVNSVLSLAVYLRVIIPMYFTEGVIEKKRSKLRAVWTIAVIITVAAGIGVQWLLKFIK
jgi:NADH:ubiquinone oxidoreductase subunit 2 (subunit N)